MELSVWNRLDAGRQSGRELSMRRLPVSGAADGGEFSGRLIQTSGFFDSRSAGNGNTGALRGLQKLQGVQL